MVSPVPTMAESGAPPDRVGAGWHSVFAPAKTPEAIVAAHCGLRVLGLSLITNHAAGVAATPLLHAEVVEAARLASPRFETLVAGAMARLSA